MIGFFMLWLVEVVISIVGIIFVMRLNICERGVCCMVRGEVCGGFEWCCRGDGVKVVVVVVVMIVGVYVSVCVFMVYGIVIRDVGVVVEVI